MKSLIQHISSLLVSFWMVFPFLGMASISWADDLPHGQDKFTEGFSMPFQDNESEGVKRTASNTIKEIIKYSGLLSIIAVTWGAIMYMTSLGDEGKIKTAKSIVMYALIGLFLCLGAYTIVDMVGSLSIHD